MRSGINNPGRWPGLRAGRAVGAGEAARSSTARGLGEQRPENTKISKISVSSLFFAISAIFTVKSLSEAS
jgi:hypothetical protein